MGTITRLNQAKKKLSEAESQMPGAYQNGYADNIRQKLGQLAQASDSFGTGGADSDALNEAYQQYRAKAVGNAQNGAAAAADTASALGGGYGTDWAQTAANQAAGEQIAGVDNSLSGLRADALQNWKQKLSDTGSVLDDLLGQQSLDRAEYDGSVSNAQDWRDYLSSRVDTARQENTNFWNNVWTGVKGVGSAVWNGYQNYEKYGQQKLQIQAQGYQMAQEAYNSGNPDQARQIMEMYGLDSTQVDKWTESYTTRQNKVNGLTEALSFAKAGSMDAAREALRQYGLDETILDTWQGMTDVEKDQMDAALNAMSASASGNNSAKNTILQLAGLDTGAVDDYDTVAGRVNNSNLAYEEALQKMQNKYGLDLYAGQLKLNRQYAGTGSSGSSTRRSSGSSSGSTSSGSSGVRYSSNNVTSLLNKLAGLDESSPMYGVIAGELQKAGVNIGGSSSGNVNTQSAAGSGSGTAAGTGNKLPLAVNKSPAWTNGTRNVLGTVNTTNSLAGDNLTSGLNVAKTMTDNGKSPDEIMDHLIRAGYTDNDISRISNVMGW